MRKNILHTVNQSPFKTTLLKDCLMCFENGDSLLLLNDGVYGALQQQPYAAQLPKKKCYALLEDLKKRGFEELDCISSIELIDYQKFVALTVEYSLTQSWY